MDLVVQKYGGTSVGSIERLNHVANHIATTVQSGKRTVIVVSAMGQQTDELIALAEQLSPHPPRRELDMLLSTGERISMALLSIALHERRVPSMSLTGSQSGILTDNNHGNARIEKILGDRIRDGLEQNKVVIVAGFQGVCPRTREITTLGRGGSDLSAIAIAATLSARRCELYKDVDGVMTTDPRRVKEARLIKRLSWDSLCAMSWAGAAVLHARGAHVAQKFKIPLEIRSSFKLEQSGTLIGEKNRTVAMEGMKESAMAMESVSVQAISHRSPMALIFADFSLKAQVAGARSLGDLSQWLWKQGEASSLSSCVQDENGTHTGILVNRKLAAQTAAYIGELGGSVKIVDDVACVTMVGCGFWQSPETIAKVNSLVPDIKSLQVTNTTVTLCIRETDLDSTLTALHRAFIEV